MHSWTKLLSKLAVIAIAVLALAIPASAAAATVVNGDFETGNLSGWQQFNQTGAGEWFTYNSAEAEGFFPPPSGNFAALDNQISPDLDILYQDVALEPGYTHQLALWLYYQSSEPILAPPTLNLEGGNQQMRVDVMKPTAPINSVAPEDILATVFANKTGDPEVMPPTHLTADLSAFAGQTVRLRIANAVTEGPFNTGVDGVSITSTPIPPPSNVITKGKLALNKKKGTGKLTINVPGPGTLHVVSKGKKKTIKTVNLAPTAAGALKVPLNPTGVGRKALKNKGKLKAQLEVTFTPTGGLPNTQIYKVTLKKTLPKKR
jgi:FtsP/CotA-like multicopper oxidase with cupredoxin domain